VDETTYYYRHDNGGYEVVTVTGDAEYVPPAGAVEISQAEYEAGVAAVAAHNDAHLADLRDADRQTALADYQALIAAGIPEETARRLSGYTPDPDLDDDAAPAATMAAAAAGTRRTSRARRGTSGG
jgi:hypothetical protein